MLRACFADLVAVRDPWGRPFSIRELIVCVRGGDALPATQSHGLSRIFPGMPLHSLQRPLFFAVCFASSARVTIGSPAHEGPLLLNEKR